MKTIGIRTRVAVRLANLCLRLADPWYRQMVAGAIQYGLNAAARDHKEGRTAPGIAHRQHPGGRMSTIRTLADIDPEPFEQRIKDCDELIAALPTGDAAVHILARQRSRAEQILGLLEDE